MCPVLSQWENGEEITEGHDGPIVPGPAIERDWRQSLPKTLEKAERPPDPEASFCNPLTKRRGYSKLVNEYYNKQNEILSQFNDLDTFEERMATNADAMVSRSCQPRSYPEAATLAANLKIALQYGRVPKVFQQPQS